LLQALSIRNILLIESLDMEFSEGLNVLTGETGAGKSILLDALGFVLGWRGKADIVRQGAESGEVSAEFSVPPDHEIHVILDDAGLPMAASLLLRRVTNRDGRKRAFVNDRACSGEILRRLSAHLVEIHGQHDDKGLLDPKSHRAMLDEYAGTSEDFETVRGAWRERTAAQKTLATARAELLEAAKDAEYLRHALSELDSLAPQVGEDAELDRQRRVMQAAARIRDDIGKAGQAMSLDGAEGLLSDAMRWLEDAAPQADGRLETPLEALGRALSELADAQSGVEDALDALNFNPHELEQVEERLFAIRALGRKHAVLPDALSELAEGFRERLEKIDMGAGHITALEKAVLSAEARYDTVAAALSQKRHAAGLKLDSAMAAELAPLKMERAIFTTDVIETEAGPEGIDRVAFTVATNPGAPKGPIDKIASGGELSRFLLALKVCLSARATDLTMIFDEIDRGVGGATADAVGRRLSNLAKGGQVLVVTHSPQVAALGAHHWMVSKSITDGQTTTMVRPLATQERIDEIARMLSGDSVSHEARAAAQVLLDAKD